MNRRDFMKSSAAASIAVVPSIALTQELAKAPTISLLVTPTTPENLYTAINSIFKNRGSFDASSMVQDGRHIRFKSYFGGDEKLEGYGPDIDMYYPTPQQPVIALWNRILDFKADIRNDWGDEMMADFGAQGVTHGKSVWWRSKPEIIETKNKLYTVRIRAAFT